MLRASDLWDHSRRPLRFGLWAFCPCYPCGKRRAAWRVEQRVKPAPDRDVWHLGDGRYVTGHELAVLQRRNHVENGPLPFDLGARKVSDAVIDEDLRLGL